MELKLIVNKIHSLLGVASSFAPLRKKRISTWQYGLKKPTYLPPKDCFLRNGAKEEATPRRKHGILLD